VGQLGDGTTTTRDDVVETDRFEPALTQVDTDVPFVSITAGYNHTCALDAAGRAYCWGDNRNGELGSALTGDCDGWSQAGPEPSCQARPVPVETSLEFRSLAGGASFTCGLTADGQAYCWGLGNEGQLGAGSRASAKTGPVPVVGGLRFASLSAGTNHVCGVSVEGRAYCWGGGAEGQLGTGFVTDRLEPAEVKLQANP
jgi:alpha-tubulin suppressor-like RCC1 family protein